MRFPPSFLEQLRDRIPISDIVGRKVNLKHKSGGEYIGLCCFHNEKTPSFTVSNNKGFYHCFGCGAHGDIVRFIMETEGRSFMEAVSELASQAGLKLPEPDPKAQEKQQKITSLYDVTEAACKFFESNISQTAAQYLAERGITQETARTFRLGYAPETNNALKEYMQKAGFTGQQLIDTGLVIKKDSQEPYDRFRGRVIFPIMDSKQRVIAFGGRILGDGQPKYLNSPETDLFHKSNVLYNFNNARQVAYDKGGIAVVEGYMDVIALHQAGIRNVVAPLGTSVTEEHLRILWRVADEPVMCLDGDMAGQRAMVRAAELCLPMLEPGKSLGFTLLPTGKDPDDVVRTQGLQAMRQLLGSAMPLSGALWNISGGNKPLATPERKAAFEQRLMGYVEKIRHDTVKHHYRRYFRDRLWKMGQNRKAVQTGNISELKPASNRNVSQKERYEILLVATILNHPEILGHDTGQHSVEDEFFHIEMSSPALTAIQNAIIEAQSQSDSPDYEQLHEYIEKAGLKKQVEDLLADKFLDPFVRREADSYLAKAGWSYILSCYRCAVVEEEYNLKAQSLSPENDSNITPDIESLEELRKQRDILTAIASRERTVYENALEE